jgi:hypothetical protein
VPESAQALPKAEPSPKASAGDAAVAKARVDLAQARTQAKAALELRKPAAERVAAMEHALVPALTSVVAGLAHEALQELLHDKAMQEPPCHSLFLWTGPVARGEAMPHSDVDFALAIADETQRPFFVEWMQRLQRKVDAGVREPDGFHLCQGGSTPLASQLLLGTPATLAKAFRAGNGLDVRAARSALLARHAVSQGESGGAPIDFGERALETKLEEELQKLGKERHDASGLSLLQYDALVDLWNDAVAFETQSVGKPTASLVDLDERLIGPLAEILARAVEYLAPLDKRPTSTLARAELLAKLLADKNKNLQDDYRAALERLETVWPALLELQARASLEARQGRPRVATRERWEREQALRHAERVQALEQAVAQTQAELQGAKKSDVARCKGALAGRTAALQRAKAEKEPPIGPAPHLLSDEELRLVTSAAATAREMIDLVAWLASSEIARHKLESDSAFLGKITRRSPRVGFELECSKIRTWRVSGA